MVNHYEILGIEPSATQEQIKKAFRINAVRFHPDKNAGDPFFAQKFIEIKTAYDILSNSVTRAEYDIHYYQFFAKNEPGITEHEKRYREEKAKQKKKEQESFRFDPFKTFYSDNDREQQETPQYPPKQTPWGQKIGESLEFFALPKTIGKIIGGYSDLPKGQKAISSFQLFFNLFKSSLQSISIAFGICFLLYLHWTFNLHKGGTLLPAIIFFLIAISIIIWFKYGIHSNDKKFEFINYFIGINGFALFKCQGTRENLIINSEVNFNDVTDLITSHEIRKYNFNYVNTAYNYLWINRKINKIVFQNSGLYSDKDGQPNKYMYPEYHFNVETEKYWTVYLLDNMEKELELQGYLQFNL